MLPGMKVKTEPDKDVGEEDVAKDDEAEEDDEEPSMPTPRKRLMNFKIPLVPGVGQRRDQSMSVIRRRLFSGKGACVYSAYVRRLLKYKLTNIR